MEKTYKHHWIEISESGIGFLKSSDSRFIDGFYTTEVESCIGIVIVGKNEKYGELTFIHMDASSKKDKLLEVLKDVKTNKQNYTVKLVINEIHLRDREAFLNIFDENILGTLNDLVCGNIVRLIPLNKEESDVSFTVSRNGDVCQVNKKFTLAPYFSKEEEIRCRLLINRLNKMFSDKENIDFDVQFKGEQRTLPPEIIPVVRTIMEKEGWERDDVFDKEVEKATGSRQENLRMYKTKILEFFDDLKISLKKTKVHDRQISL